MNFKNNKDKFVIHQHVTIRNKSDFTPNLLSLAIDVIDDNCSLVFNQKAK
jgi:hypothetical protein